LIIGGSDAGISAALRAREIDHSLHVTVLVADDFPNYSICGLPFYLSGEIKDWHSLAHRGMEEIEKEGIQVLLSQRATLIDPKGKTVSSVDKKGNALVHPYDKLIIGTGAVSARPAIEGLDLPGVYFLRWMGDGMAIHDYLISHGPKSVTIVGSGYISMEMADALIYRGISVTVLARSGSVLKTVDPEMGGIIRKVLQDHGVNVIDQVQVSAIERDDETLVLRNNRGISLNADMVLVAVGSRPETALAEQAGVLTGAGGAIQVNRAMETNLPHIYAAGDCAETWHCLLDTTTYLPLGSTAHKQGRVAGENAAGGNAEFAGSLGTQVVKVFDRVVARTGLREMEAREAAFDPLTVEMETWDHKAYYPGATRMRIRITGDRHSGRLLGAQMIGHHSAEVSKRIDVLATAIFNGMSVEELGSLDLSYTPPLSSPWDPIQMSAQKWTKEHRTAL
jgi:NADPH-dependent 2,4-dienoyl-CoA reductase/sulfur reductase-like enzyme